MAIDGSRSLIADHLIPLSGEPAGIGEPVHEEAGGWARGMDRLFIAATVGCCSRIFVQG